MLKPNTHAIVLRAITAERQRQEQLREAGKFEYTCADNKFPNLPNVPVTHYHKMAVATEEVGEVAKAVNEGNTGELYKEAIQAAACFAAWAESLL
jgi:hypothetical protein